MFRTSPFGGYFDPFQQYYAPPQQFGYGAPRSRAVEPEEFDPYSFAHQRHPARSAPQQPSRHPKQQKQQKRTADDDEPRVPVHQQHLQQQQQARAAAKQAAALKQRQTTFARKVQDRRARVIQIWWRRVAAARRAEKEEAAAAVLQRFLRHATATRRTRAFLHALHALHATEARLRALRDTYLPRITGRAPGTAKDLLAFEDAIDKTIISLDGISIRGNDDLRAERKRIVRVAQGFLSDAAELSRRAVIIQRWWRAHLARANEARKPAAARTILHALQRMHVRDQARHVVDDLRALRRTRADMHALAAQFQQQLAALAARAAAIDTHDSDAAASLADQIRHESSALLGAVATHLPKH